MHANSVARRRYEGAAQGLLQANVRTSLHRNVAFERDRALRQWVLDVASHNSTSLARRWVGVVTLASKTQALGRRLKRMRDVRRAQNMFFAVALLAGRVRWDDLNHSSVLLLLFESGASFGGNFAVALFVFCLAAVLLHSCTLNFTRCGNGHRPTDWQRFFACKQ